jgi:hypothetical protein
MHERAGPFIVTLFSTPDNLAAGPADLSLGVEDAETGELINDAEIDLSLSRIDSGSKPQRDEWAVLHGPECRNSQPTRV